MAFPFLTRRYRVDAVLRLLDQVARFGSRLGKTQAWMDAQCDAAQPPFRPYHRDEGLASTSYANAEAWNDRIPDFLATSGYQ